MGNSTSEHVPLTRTTRSARTPRRHLREEKQTTERWGGRKCCVIETAYVTVVVGDMRAYRRQINDRNLRFDLCLPPPPPPARLSLELRFETPRTSNKSRHHHHSHHHHEQHQRQGIGLGPHRGLGLGEHHQGCHSQAKNGRCQAAARQPRDGACSHTISRSQW